MRKITVVFLMGILCSMSLYALSPEIRFDMLKEKLTQELQANEYTQALSTMSEIRSLGIKVPKSFTYFEGKALFESGKEAEAYTKLESYLDSNGKKGKYYKQALAYLIKADKKVKEERKRVEAKNAPVIIGGLMWQDGNIVSKNWEGAKDYCEDFTSAGYSDWRLPSTGEIQSLHSNRSKLKNNVSGNFWSSNEDGLEAWAVGFFDSTSVYHDPKFAVRYIRCVRSGQ